MSSERSRAPIDCGSHHCRNSSGVVHASKTRRAGASNVRLTTTSRSEVRSTLTGRAASGSLFPVLSTGALLVPQSCDDIVQRAEARVPQLLVPLHPCRHVLEAVHPDPAAAHAPDLLGRHEAGGLEDLEVL